MPYLKQKNPLRSNPLYSIWLSMKARCLRLNHPSYQYYGGRGIKICDEWLADKRRGSGAFIKWAENNGYKEGLTLDRIENNGNYEPSNCRWVSRAVQNRNIRKNIYLTFNGQTKLLVDWAEELNISRKTLFFRKYKGWPVDKILSKENFRKGPVSGLSRFV